MKPTKLTWKIYGDIAKLNTDKINLIIRLKVIKNKDNTITINGDDIIFINHVMNDEEFNFYMKKVLLSLLLTIKLHKIPQSSFIKE
jgi:hypothetical protein